MSGTFTKTVPDTFYSPQSLKSYTLEAISAATGTVHVITIVTSTDGNPLPNINGAVLGQFDPTMLANGAYDLRLTATNFNDYTATVDQEVNVSGELKLGNFRLTYTDLTVPVAGIPITITRTYERKVMIETAAVPLQKRTNAKSSPGLE